jgi:hypothetical protein
MADRAVQWKGTAKSWAAIRDLYSDLEDVAFRTDGNLIDAATVKGRETVMRGWWLVRHEDGAIEVQKPLERKRAAGRVR